MKRNDKLKQSNKLNINRFLQRFGIHRKYKDRLFQRIFQDKKDLLDLYNAVNGTSYLDINDLEITTLEDAIYLSMKNDLSFIISSSMNLYEHQSTFNPNMPVRGFLYFARLYEGYIKREKLDIYSSKLIPLPFPQYIVFYNGSLKQPDERILKLSDAFIIPTTFSDKEPALECRARMLNINYGHNKKLLDSCKRLHDYSYFIAEINQNLSYGMKLAEAINAAIETCIEKDVLTDILEKCRSEVYDMLLTEYNEKEYLKIVKKNEHAEGVQEGMQEGIKMGDTKRLILLVCKKIQKGKSLEQISDELEESTEVILPIYNASLNCAPDYDIDKIYEILK